jgi:hypothetical protein
MQRLCLAWDVEWRQDWRRSDAYLGNAGLNHSDNQMETPWIGPTF